MIKKVGKKIYIQNNPKDQTLLAMLQKAIDRRNENSSRTNEAASLIENEYYQIPDLTDEDRQAILETIVQVVYDGLED